MRRAWAVLGWVAAAVAGAAPASPWPQFRGPGGQGQVSGPLPVAWGEGKNVAWKTPIPGSGWSSPVVAAGAVWVTTGVPTGDKGVSLRLVGVDLDTGRVRHDVELFAAARPATLHARNTTASPTPAVVGNLVVASFGSDGVGCVDAATGKVAWRTDAFKVEYQTGPGSSPAPYKGRVILPCDGSDAQFVVALDAATGKVAWKAERPGAAKRPENERRAFSTPLVVTAGGRDQVVIPGGHTVYSYDPDTGAELWRAGYTGFSNVPRPVFANGLVYVSTGYYAHELLAIRPDGRGDVTASHVAWRAKKGLPNVPSPVAANGLLFLVADTGLATCLDGKSGEVRWTERIPGAYTASPLVAGDTVYAFADDGRAVLFKASGDGYEEVARNELPGRIQATPAAVGGSLIVRTDAALYRIAGGRAGG